MEEVVNDGLRRGLAEVAAGTARKKFLVKARNLERVRPGLDLDNIGELLDLAEGPRHR